MKVKVYKDFNNKKRVLKINFSDKEAINIYNYLDIKVSERFRQDQFIPINELVERLKNNETDDLLLFVSSRWKDPNGANLRYMKARNTMRIEAKYRGEYESRYWVLDDFGSSNIQRRDFKYNISIIRAVPFWDSEKKLFIIEMDITSAPLMDEDVIFLVDGFKTLIDNVYKSTHNKYYAMDINIKEI